MPDELTGKKPTISQTPGGGVPTGPMGPVTQNPAGTSTVPPIVTPTGAPGGGIDWAQWLGLGASAIGGLYGAYSQNQANSANTAAQQAQLAMLNARQAQVTQGAQSMMQQGQNPYSALLMQMLGGARPSGSMTPGSPIGVGLQQPNFWGQPGAPSPAGPWGPSIPTNTLQNPGPAFQDQGKMYGSNQSVQDYLTAINTPGTPEFQAFSPPGYSFQNGAWVNSNAAAMAGQPAGTGGGITTPGPASMSMIPSPSGPSDTSGWIPQTTQALGAASPLSQMMQLPAFTSPSAIGTQALNPSQDPYLQMMRSNTLTQNDIQGTGNPFDTTDLFGALDTKNTMDLNKQVSDLQGSYGSFGQRMGSAAMNAQSNLRSTFLTNANAQRQQLAMQSYTDAQNRRLQALGIGAGREAQVGSQQLAQSGQQLGAQEFNAQQTQNWNQFMMGGLTQANSMQQAQQGQNMGLLSLIAGLPMGQAPVSQPSATGGAIGDIGQLLMMYKLLGQA